LPKTGGLNKSGIQAVTLSTADLSSAGSSTVRAGEVCIADFTKRAERLACGAGAELRVVEAQRVDDRLSIDVVAQVELTERRHRERDGTDPDVA